jgi:hypothetical protein
LQAASSYISDIPGVTPLRFTFVEVEGTPSYIINKAYIKYWILDDDMSVYYRINKYTGNQAHGSRFTLGSWIKYVSHEIELTIEGEYVEFMRISDKPNTSERALRTYVTYDNIPEDKRPIGRFSLKGHIEASGNMQSMMGYSDTAPDYCYSTMFLNCSSLLTTPDLTATKLGEGCYSAMFYGCTGLKAHSDLPATDLGVGCYYGMFDGCTSLVDIAKELPVTELKANCYTYMYARCAAITEAPSLPATEMKRACYAGMFASCTSLLATPELPATILAPSCYEGMFSCCTALTKAAALPATTVREQCYYAMFSGCINITEAPSLPALIMEPYCYGAMWSNTGLLVCPVLPATTMAEGCYSNMFAGCEKLSIPPEQLPANEYFSWSYADMFAGSSVLYSPPTFAMTKDWSASQEKRECSKGIYSYCNHLRSITLLSNVPLGPYEYAHALAVAPCCCVINTDHHPWATEFAATFNWVGIIGEGTGVAEFGKFYKNSALNKQYTLFPGFTTKTGLYSFIPPYWYHIFDRDKKIGIAPPETLPENFENETPLRLTAAAFMNTTISYVTYYIHDEEPVYYRLTGAKEWKLYPNGLMIKLLPEEYVEFYRPAETGNANNKDKPAEEGAAIGGFVMSGCIHASGDMQSMMNYKRVAPANCYRDMFRACACLITPPVLTATTIEEWAYYAMFGDCAMMQTAPELNATNIAANCYALMFYGCDQLREAPKILPATKLAERCYYGMFAYCFHLRIAPYLPATTLEKECYTAMFARCAKLAKLSVAFTDWGDDIRATYYMLVLAGTYGDAILYKPAALPTGKTYWNGYPYVGKEWTVVSR